MTEGDLIEAAKAGDRRSFEVLVEPHMSGLRSLTYRLVGYREDARDLLQESMVRAWTGIRDFRSDSRFRTWLFAITTHVCLDYLRKQNRWGWDAQVEAEQECRASPSLRQEVLATLADPSFVFDVYEHIAFCFTCVARSLPPEEEVAVILREVFQFSNLEAAKIVGISESVFRHRLAAGRHAMQEAFDGLCALINKQGACYQCEGLRESTPDQRRGPTVSEIGKPGSSRNDRFRARVRIARDANLEGGKTRLLHDLVFSRIYRAHQNHPRPNRGAEKTSGGRTGRDE